MYLFYVETYRGVIIPSVTAFNQVLNRATAYVDALVISRDNLKIEAINTKYKMAICAVAEIMYEEKETSDVTSESVGNHSKSYSRKSSNEYKRQMKEEALLYLHNTGLLFGALR